LALLPNGDLVTVDELTAERAGWFATVLLKLDLDPWKRARAEVCKVVAVAEKLLQSNIPDDERSAALDVLVQQLAARWLLIEALDYPVSDTLRQAVVERRTREASK